MGSRLGNGVKGPQWFSISIFSGTHSQLCGQWAINALCVCVHVHSLKLDPKTHLCQVEPVFKSLYSYGCVRFYHGILHRLWSPWLCRWAAVDWVAHKLQEFIFHSDVWGKPKIKLLANLRVRDCSLDLHWGHLIGKNEVSEVCRTWVLNSLRRPLLSQPNTALFYTISLVLGFFLF